MRDTASRRWIDVPLDAAARRLGALNLPASAVTVTGFVAGLAAIACIAYGHAWVGLAFLVLNRVLDALAVAAARESHAESFGSVPNATLGTVVLTGIPFAFALAEPSQAVAASFLICALAVASVARIAAPKSSGLDLAESVVVLVAFAFACLLPERFSLAAYVLGVLAFVAAGVRIAAMTAVAQR
jgi:hypothetical protein